jgi:ATP-dependent helicase/nuclease subunit A
MNDAARAQIEAAEPGASAWVSANAGSGKTRVLTDRVARLLLSGTDPQRILCLTYTKAAAAEMQNRLFDRLGAWAMMPDDRLAAALAELGETGPALAPGNLAQARTLFARALETPGGLKIQTIHAFCDTLLRRFPLEAGVAPQFAVLDDPGARALREEVLEALAIEDPIAFAAMARHLSGDDPDPLAAEIASRRALFADPFDPARLAEILGADPALTPQAIADAVLTPGTRDLLRALVPVLQTGGVTDQRAGARLGTALAATTDTLLDTLESLLLYGEGARKNVPFTAKIGGFPTKSLRAAHSALMPALDALMLRVEDARRRRIARAAWERSCALNAFARGFLDRYAARKAAAGLLDFEDLIERARILLEDPETAAWVLWRLDGGLDHILVDEAQDTSPAQWRVIGAISAEFFAGTGARDLLRTIFVVGDEKQSIYSFQGADPAAFADMRAVISDQLDALESALRPCDLIWSFRSAPPVLKLVDAVFGGPFVAGFDGIEHRAFHAGRPGRVELWRFQPKPDKPEETPWDEPVDMPAPDDPVFVLAEDVATEIAHWLSVGRVLPGRDRAIGPGDVAILVQRRGPLFHAIIRALKRNDVPVAGADVLRIGGELAVKDLLAALRFAVTPADDLSLAAFLRSPIGGLSESQLFRLAHGRPGTLWQALRLAPEHGATRAMLADLAGQADFLRPYEMLQRLLIRHGARSRLIARLGAEAEDGIDALLDQALAYERAEPPSLTGFIAWMDRAEVTVKRRSDEGGSQVRVMTVHGAKGLEAEIVILPDTAQRREGSNRPAVLPLPGGLAGWAGAREASPPALVAADDDRRLRAEAENLRLLYVALTRARTWLIVAGAGKEGKEPADSWHGLVAEAMDRLGAATDPHGRRVMSEGWTEAAASATPVAVPAAEALPGWAARPAPVPATPPVPLSPSALGGAHVLPAEVGAGGDAAALDRGTRIHLLLEHLHGRPAAARADCAARLLPGLPEAEELLAEAAAVLDAPDLAPVFGPDSLAEVEVTAELAELGHRRIRGRIDRLVVGRDRVLALDFKSNRVLPARPEDVPEALLRQMGAYAAALAQLWPGRRVETAVLWTRGPLLMALPAPLTAAALARASAALAAGEGFESPDAD